MAAERQEPGGEKAHRRVAPIRRCQDLLVYQQAYRLALEVSKLTGGFPRREEYEIERQLRSSSRSIPANIIEGWAKRNSAAEFKRHLQLGTGECEETKFWLDLAADEGCAPRARCQATKLEYTKLGAMIYNLWRQWRKLP